MQYLLLNDEENHVRKLQSPKDLILLAELGFETNHTAALEWIERATKVTQNFGLKQDYDLRYYYGQNNANGGGTGVQQDSKYQIEGSNKSNEDGSLNSDAAGAPSSDPDDFNLKPPKESSSGGADELVEIKNNLPGVSCYAEWKPRILHGKYFYNMSKYPEKTNTTKGGGTGRILNIELSAFIILVSNRIGCRWINRPQPK